MREVNEIDDGEIEIPQSPTGLHREPEIDNQLDIKQREDLKALILEFQEVF